MCIRDRFRDIQNANGTTMGLRIGETVRRIDLLNAMLIVSANDAASVIAYDVGGAVTLGRNVTVGHSALVHGCTVGAVSYTHLDVYKRQCQECISRHGLEMKLVEAEYTLDRSKIMFYFTADRCV